MLLSTAESSAYSAQEVAARLRVDVRTGLRWSEANSRSKIVGYNELNALDDEPPWMKYVQQFKNPLILLLLGKLERGNMNAPMELDYLRIICVVISVFLGSALVSACMRQFDDAISITIAIIIVVTVAFIQEYRSEKSLEELKKLVPPECHW